MITVSNPKKFIVKQDDQGLRLDIFLAAKMDKTRSQVQKIIKDGKILVNNKAKTPHYAVRTGDIIKVLPPPTAKPATPSKLETVFVNSDFIVINKPAGLVVHPPDKSFKEVSLSQMLVERFPEIKSVGEKNRPGIVHRLDKEVSGLMVTARNQTAFDFLKNEFAQRRVKKFYTGLVIGRIKNDFGEIKFKIAHKVKGGRMAARPQEQAGKEAITFWRVLKRFKNFTLLEIEIKTGRTHQIRVHLHALGHPLAGDPLYKLKKPSKIIAPRLFLHSSTLGFNNMNQEWMEFNSDLPDELKNALENIK